MVKVSHSAPTGVNYPNVEQKNCPICKYPLFFPIEAEAQYATPRFVEIFVDNSKDGKEKQKRWTWQKSITNDGVQYHRRCLVDYCIEKSDNNYLDITFMRSKIKPLVLSWSDKIDIQRDQNQWGLFDAKMKIRKKKATELPLFYVEQQRKKKAERLWMLYLKDESEKDIIIREIKKLEDEEDNRLAAARLQLKIAKRELKEEEEKGEENLQAAQEAEMKVSDLKARLQEIEQQARLDAEKEAEDPVLARMQQHVKEYMDGGTSPFATLVETELKNEEEARKKREEEEAQERRERAAREAEEKRQREAQEAEEKREREAREAAEKKEADKAKRKEYDRRKKEKEAAEKAAKAEEEAAKAEEEAKAAREKRREAVQKAVDEAKKQREVTDAIDTLTDKKSQNDPEYIKRVLQKTLKEKFPQAGIFETDMNGNDAASSDSPGADDDVAREQEQPYEDWMKTTMETIELIGAPLSTVHPHTFISIMMEDPLDTNSTNGMLNTKDWYNYIVKQTSVQIERTEEDSEICTDKKDMLRFVVQVTGSNGWWKRYDQAALQTYLNYRLATFVATMRDYQKTKDRMARGKERILQVAPEAQWAKQKSLSTAVKDVEKCAKKTTWFAELVFKCIFCILTTPKELREFHMYIHTIPNRENGFSSFLSQLQNMLEPLNTHLDMEAFAEAKASLPAKVEDAKFWLKLLPLATEGGQRSKTRLKAVRVLKNREESVLNSCVSDQTVRDGLKETELHFIIHAVFMDGYLDVDTKEWMAPEDHTPVYREVDSEVDPNVFEVFVNRRDMTAIPHSDDSMFFGKDVALKMQPVGEAMLAIQRLGVTNDKAAEELSDKLFKTRWTRAALVIPRTKGHKFGDMTLNCNNMANYVILRWVRYNLEYTTPNTHLATEMIPELLRSLVLCNDYYGLNMLVDSLGKEIMGIAKYKHGDKILSILDVAIMKPIEFPNAAFAILCWYARQAHIDVTNRTEENASVLLDSLLFPLSDPYIPSQPGQAAMVFELLRFICNEDEDWTQHVMKHFNEEKEFINDPRSEADKQAQKRPFDIHLHAEGKANVEVDGKTYVVQKGENFWFIEGINQMVLRNSADPQDKKARNNFMTCMVRALPFAAHGFYNKFKLYEKGVPNLEEIVPSDENVALVFPWDSLEDNSPSPYVLFQLS